MPTTWLPATRPFPKSWLLANGDVLHEPPLETTSTHLKMRVAGESKSYFTKDTDQLLKETAVSIAQSRSTEVWLDITEDLSDQISTSLGVDHRNVRPKLHFLNPDLSQTLLWWRFTDPASAFEVLVWLQAKKVGYNSTSETVTLAASVPAMSPSLHPSITHASDGRFYNLLANSCDSPQERRTWEDFTGDNTTDLGRLLCTQRASNARDAVQMVLRLVRSMDALSQIEVPDMSDKRTPRYRTLDFESSNLNAQTVGELVDYLNEGPAAEQAADHYRAMLENLRSSGILVNAKSENQFLTAMLGGEDDVLNVKVRNPVDAGDSIDDDHSLWVHLPTGTFLVECARHEIDRDEVAQAWDEAKTVASLTGEEDLLMAYARAYVADAQKKRSKEIIAQRRGR